MFTKAIKKRKVKKEISLHFVDSCLKKGIPKCRGKASALPYKQEKLRQE
jgi:hypothetical protein